MEQTSTSDLNRPAIPNTSPYASLAVLGGGESGTGAALLAAKAGIDVFLSDVGIIAPAYRKLLEQAGVPFEEGRHSLDRLLAAQAIIKSPGISPKAAAVQAARQAGLPVIDELELAGYFARGRRICITGSNGKTTTTLLIYHLLHEAGFSVGLGGNVGRSLAGQLAEGADPDWWVLETSSFQLDGMEHFHIDIALLLNITPDHLDRYGSLEAYADSKLRISRNLARPDTLIYMSDGGLVERKVQEYLLPRGPHAPHKLAYGLQQNDELAAWVSNDHLHAQASQAAFSLPLEGLPLKGPHNQLNMAAATLACLSAGADADRLAAAFISFRNAPHRLEPVGQINGVYYVNDSKATNPDSVRYALSAVEAPIVWIAGGKDKGNDYSEIADLVRAKVHTLICLTKYPEPLLAAFSGHIPQIQVTQNVREAVELAARLANPGDTVLLSPACASFDLFRNYEDRGDQFREAVQLLGVVGGSK